MPRALPQTRLRIRQAREKTRRDATSFFRFPAEIRNTIYSLVIPETLTFDSCKHPQTEYATVRSLLQTSKKVAEECSYIISAKSRVNLDVSFEYYDGLRSLEQRIGSLDRNHLYHVERMIFRAAVADKINKTESQFLGSEIFLTFDTAVEAGFKIKFVRLVNGRSRWPRSWLQNFDPPPIVDRLNETARKIIKERKEQRLSVENVKTIVQIVARCSKLKRRKRKRRNSVASETVHQRRKCENPGTISSHLRFIASTL